MDKVLLLSLASALVTAQQPEFIQQADFNQQQQQQQQADFDQQYQPGPIDPTISFNYGYEVNDKDTGNSQTHQEALENGVLRGSYSVVQPDGNRRIVEYEADEISGFQAKVRYEPGYPLPPQRRPTEAAGPKQGPDFGSGPRPNRPNQGVQLTRPSQGQITQGLRHAPQQQRFPIGTPSQGPRFAPLRPLPAAPAKFIGGPPPNTSQFQGSRTSSSSNGQSSSSSTFGQSSSSGIASSISQGRPTGSTAQRSQFGPGRFTGAPSGSQFIGSSRPTGPLPQLPSRLQLAGQGPASSARQQGGAQGSRFNPESSSQTSSVSSQSSGASGASQIGQSGPVSRNPTFAGGPTQRFSSVPRLQAGPPPAAPVQFRPRPGAPSGLRSNAPAFPQSLGPAVRPPNDVAVQIAPSGFFSQFSGAGQAGVGGATQTGARGAGSSSISQNRGSSSAFHSNNAASAFQVGPGSRFGAQGGPSFDQLISSSLLVTNENLDNIEAVELASAGFDDSAYAYRLVPVPVNN